MLSFPCLYTRGKQQASSAGHLATGLFLRLCAPFNLPYLTQHYLLHLANLCIITYSGCCLQMKAFMLLALLLLPTFFCLFCSLSCQLTLSLYARPLGFFLLLLPFQLELSYHLPLLPLVLTDCELASAIGNLVLRRPLLMGSLSFLFFLLQLNFAQHFYILCC